jgi:hypothetical protein
MNHKNLEGVSSFQQLHPNHQSVKQATGFRTSVIQSVFDSGVVGAEVERRISKFPFYRMALYSIDGVADFLVIGRFLFLI